jgi:hypothetical protein
VAVTAAILGVEELDEDYGANWDALAEGRGSQADIFDTWAWHSAALGVDPLLARRVETFAVLRDGTPRVLLPLARTRTGTRRNIGAGIRARRRVVIGAEFPDPAELDLLVNTITSRTRALELLRLPSRDPLTHELIAALRRAGWHVTSRQESEDRLAPVVGGWAGHSETFQSFAKYSRRFASRIEQSWSLDMDTYGAHPDTPAVVGFEQYVELQARSWKGPLDPRTYRRRLALVQRAQQRGWVRVFVLRIGGIPAAAHLWFRVGGVATWMSTAHDQSLNALSPGTVAQWWAQERLVNDPVGTPAILDFLPGGSPQKDRLSPLRPALLEVDAVRTPAMAGVFVSAQRTARRVGPAATARARMVTNRLESLAARARPRTVGTARTITVDPARTPQAARRLDPDEALTGRLLAVATGHDSTSAARADCDVSDAWWLVGDPAIALVRVSGPPAPVAREVVDLSGTCTPGDAVASVAAALAEPVSMDLPRDGSVSGTEGSIVLKRSVLPWPTAADAAHERSPGRHGALPAG